MKQGDLVYVKVGRDWIPGIYYDECAIGHRIEVLQIKKGDRRYKVKGSQLIWPYTHRYAVKVLSLRELKPRERVEMPKESAVQEKLI